MIFSEIPDFDHYAIGVNDLQVSLHFYVDILGLKIKERPAFDFEGAWLELNNGSEIHLIKSSENFQSKSGSRSLHFAFKHPDLLSAVEVCLLNDIEFKPIKTRPDGIKQLFIKDPDGYWIELCEK